MAIRMTVYFLVGKGLPERFANFMVSDSSLDCYMNLLIYHEESALPAGLESKAHSAFSNWLAKKIILQYLKNTLLPGHTIRTL
jgi:hypothetical protein